MATIELFNDGDSGAVARGKINTSLTNLNNDKIEADAIADFETTTQLNARDTANRNRANHTGTQTASTISDFDTEVSNNTDVAANTSARHTHSNKALLDTYTQTEVDLADAVTKKHTHSNKTILDNTTASFTTADETKLDGIEAGAEVNTLNDVIAGTNITIDKTDPLNPIINSTGGGGGATALDDLTDVTITTPANGQALTYNGTQWVNFTPAGGGDMLKSVYDTNDDGIVNQADVITNQGDLATLDSVNTAQITNGAVENTKLANMNANTVKGRLSGSGTPQDVAMADLPISTATQTALNGKQNILSEGAFINGDKTKLDGIEAGAEVNTVDSVNGRTGAITGLAEDNEVVKLTGNQTIGGIKTFSSSPIVPTPTTDMEVATKKYVDDNAGKVGTKTVDETSIADDKILVYNSTSGNLEYEAKPTGSSTKQHRITIPGEQIADTANYQGLYFYNDTGATITISNVAFAVGKAAAGSGAACAMNIYKSSGTAADGLNTNAVNLFTTAVDLGTGYTSLTNVPNTTTVEAGRWVTLRVTSSAGSTNKASDLQCIISYS